MDMTNLDLNIAELETMEAPDIWAGFTAGIASTISAIGVAAAIVALT
ncbi:hypothetical protein [Arthrobacter sp. MA-N2]|nr:hypothetical protein [Arthrobacter sp. MA-N2]